MEAGTIICLEEADVDDFAERHPDTEYPVFGITVGRQNGRNELCILYYKNTYPPNRQQTSSWWVDKHKLTVLEEP